MATTITEPGIYDDVPHADYHADPVAEGSLSCSGAKRLLPPSCPAKFKHERDNPPEPTHYLDVGNAAHKLLLGVGPEIEVVDAPDWRTKAAREARDEARERGAVPLLAEDYAQAQERVATLKQHPLASVLFDPDSGNPEQSIFWRDHSTKIMRRARLDWLPKPRQGDGRLFLPDYKTCRSADPKALARDINTWRYHMQAAWYVDGLDALGYSDDIVFLLVFQERDAPYLVTVAEMDQTALKIGRRMASEALDIYHACITTDTWPGYSDEVELLSLPYWAEREHEEEYA